MHDRAEVVVGKHHMRRLSRYIAAPTAHSDTDMGLFQGRSVVHTVSGDGDDLAKIAQTGDDA